MKTILGVAAAAALLATGASAQMVILDLTGRYRCVELCASDKPGQFGFIAQNGTEFNLVDDAGTPWRGYVERPGRLWVHRMDQGATYSADGMTIQFDRGTLWQRDLGEAAPSRRRAAPRAPAPVARATAYDGSWNVTIVTQAGPCDPQYRFGAQIVNGSVVYDGSGPVNLQGQVSPNGAVWVSIAAGSGRADGEGRLSQNFGNGAWRGQGTLGLCTGVWEAVRTG